MLANGHRLAAPGVYTYTVEDDGAPHDEATLTVGQPSGTQQEHVLRVSVDNPLEVSQLLSYESGTVTALRSRESLGRPGSEADCQWQPAVIVLPVKPRHGARWTVDTRCDYVRHDKRYSVSRRETATIEGTAAIDIGPDTYVGHKVHIEGTRQTTGADDSQRNYIIDAVVTDHAVPLQWRENLEISLAGAVLMKTVRQLTLTKLPSGH